MRKEIRPSNTGEFPRLSGGLYKVALGNSTGMEVSVFRTDNDLIIGILGKGSWKFDRKNVISKDYYGYVQRNLCLGDYKGDAKHLTDFINSQNGAYSLDNVCGNYNNILSNESIEQQFECENDMFSEQEIECMENQGYSVLEKTNGGLTIEPHGYDFTEDQLSNVIEDVIQGAKDGNLTDLHACLSTEIFTSKKKIFTLNNSISMSYESNSEFPNKDFIENEIIKMSEKILTNKTFRKSVAESMVGKCFVISDHAEEIVRENTCRANKNGLSF